MRPFAITWGEHTWTDVDVLAAHVISVADILGGTGFDVSPWDGPKQLAAWIAVFRSIEYAGDDPERAVGRAIAEVYAAPADKLLMALRPRLVEVPSGEPVAS